MKSNRNVSYVLQIFVYQIPCSYTKRLITSALTPVLDAELATVIAFSFSSGANILL